jgi:hypothetical protein
LAAPARVAFPYLEATPGCVYHPAISRCSELALSKI